MTAFLDRDPDVLYIVQWPLSVDEIPGYAARLERMGPVDQYVVDFEPLPKREGARSDESLYMVFFRRLKDPSRSDAEWQAVARRLQWLARAE